VHIKSIQVIESSFWSVQFKLLLNDCDVNWNTSKSEDVWESAYYFGNVNGLTLHRILGEQAPNKSYPAIRMKDTNNISMDGKSQK